MGLKDDADALRSWLKTGGVSSDTDAWQLWDSLAARTSDMADIPEGDRLATKEDLIGDILSTDAPIASDKKAERRRRRLEALTVSEIQKFLDEREDRYHGFLRELGFTSRLTLGVNPGGGRGRKATFYLQVTPLPDSVQEPKNDHDLQDHSSQPYPRTIHWNERPFDEIELSRRGKRAFGPDGIIPYKSWRGRFFRFKAVSQLLGMMALIYMFLGGLALDPRPVTSRDLATVLTIVLLSYLTWLWTMKPILDLGTMRASILDDWYLKGEQPPTLLERRRTANGSQIRVTRYAASCPVCSADMELAYGAPAWPGRIVGRCTDSPQEHVYTFDRVKLIGEALRLPPDLDRTQ